MFLFSLLLLLVSSLGDEPWATSYRRLRFKQIGTMRYWYGARSRNHDHVQAGVHEAFQSM